jgi:Matrixin.
MKRNKLLILFSLMLIIGFVTPASAFIILDNMENGWSHSNLSFANVRTSYGVMPADWEKSISAAAETWEKESGLKHYWIQGHESKDVSNASIQFARRSINSNYLAQATTYSRRHIEGPFAPPEIKYSIVEFNEYYNWTTNEKEAYYYGNDRSRWVFDVQSMALHEMGHSMGLGDMYTMVNGTVVNNKTKTVMNAYTGVQRTLFEDDIEGMRAIYHFNNTGENNIEPPKPFNPPELSTPRPNETKTLASKISDSIKAATSKFFPKASAQEDSYITNVIVYRTLATESLDEEVAGLIIRGVVKENTEPQWENHDGQIPTEQEIEAGEPLLIGYNTIIEVEKVYKGELPENSNEITIKRLGGTIDRTTVELNADVGYQVGDEVILYLVGDENQYYEMNNRGKIFIDKNEMSITDMFISKMGSMGIYENNDTAINAWGETVDLEQLEEKLNSLENI